MTENEQDKKEKNNQKIDYSSKSNHKQNKKKDLVACSSIINNSQDEKINIIDEN